MAFNTVSYFLFLPVTFILFLVCPINFRWLLLLAASLLFYSLILSPLLIAALSAVILLTFFSAQYIESAHIPEKRTAAFWSGAGANLLILLGMKYLPFIAENANGALSLFKFAPLVPVPPVLTSIGVSFYVFQAISYQADIYFRTARPEPHLGIFALYLSFFPKLLQGPIERAADLIPMLKEKYVLNLSNIRNGLLLIAWGLFKKTVIADHAALYVDSVYNHLQNFSGTTLIFATYAYAVQIFMDFSGYTDIAIGSALLFNIRLTSNFNAPYSAPTLAEYWRRWHISLSKWILDYIFEPLQMAFRHWGKKGTALALVITFTVCGLWHGPTWCYVLWGLLHGLFLAASLYYRPYQKRLNKALFSGNTVLLKTWQVFITFNLICFTFIFFRSKNLSDAFYVITHLFSLEKDTGISFLISQGRLTAFITVSSLIAYRILTLNLTNDCGILQLAIKNSVLRHLFYSGLVFSIFLFAYYGIPKNFIYFQF